MLGDLAHPVRSIFTLSADGCRLARRDVTRAVMVSDTADPAKTIATVSPAALHDALCLAGDAQRFVNANATLAGIAEAFAAQFENDAVIFGAERIDGCVVVHGSYRVVEWRKNTRQL